MKTKLTLSINDSTIEKAKMYAGNTGRSLSELIESYLESITDKNQTVEQVNSKLKKIAGKIKLPRNFDKK